jgi:flagellar hook-associated protein 1 FlgK
MSGLLSVGTRALQANQVALQTAGHNIANVNTPGYSRQSVVQQTVPGQFTGSGYIGKGVEIQTIERNYSTYLTRQSALAGTTAAADTARTNKLKQLQDIFAGGASGLGSAVNNMLNAFSDVATAPTDLTARAVVLARVDETAARMRTASQSMDDLQTGVTQELNVKINSINNLAKSIAGVNEKIARAQGSGQPANDLLDQRDQLVRDLNQFVQTTSIAADDGTVGIFLAGSQPLVLGNKASSVELVADDFGVRNQKLAIRQTGVVTPLDENMLGGGEVSGLLRFQNTDLAEGRNLLGRFTVAVTTSMNDQHALGLDLDGNAGGKLFSGVDLSKAVLPATGNPVPATATLTLSINDVSKFEATSYEVTFGTPATVPASGILTRLSDRSITSFTLAALPGAQEIAINGLTITIGGTAGAGDKFLVQPFSTSANNIRSEFSSPRALAVASPVAGSMGTANTGSLQLGSLTARTNLPPIAPVTIKFTGPNQYIRSDDINYGNYPPGLPLLAQPVAYSYQSGQVIEGSVAATPPPNPWSLVLQGAPKAGDTFTVLGQPTANRNRNADNASGMMGLRDVAMFDGAALSDGYAAVIAQVGIRTQSAMYASDVSNAIAANLETERTAVSGVNLDEEAAKLLQYQQAYQASAKMIQIAQSIFDTLIQTVGR